MLERLGSKFVPVIVIVDPIAPLFADKLVIVGACPNTTCTDNTINAASAAKRVNLFFTKFVVSESFFIVSISGLLKTNGVFVVTVVTTLFVGVLFINLFENANMDCSTTGIVVNGINDKMRFPFLENTR